MQKKSYIQQRWQGQPSVAKTMSPVDGVEMLTCSGATNYLKVTAQLEDYLQEINGEQSSFITTGFLWNPEMPSEAAIDAKYPILNVNVRMAIFQSAVVSYEKSADRINSTYTKIFGTIRRILDPRTESSVMLNMPSPMLKKTQSNCGK